MKSRGNYLYPLLRNMDGNMLVEGKAVRHRWAEYFDEFVECAGMCAGERCGDGW